MPRLSLTILLFVSVVALPWWASLIFLSALVLSFPWYYEGVVAVLLYELIYGLSSSVFGLTLGLLLIIPVVEWGKKRLYVFH
jgi:hypothetical protein